MSPADIIPFLGFIIGGVFILGAAGILASVHNTRLRIKHGYPLQGTWGQSLKPTTTPETTARVQLLSQENAQLKAEISAMKDRLESVERIVTDGSYRLNQEFDRLRDGREKVQ